MAENKEISEKVLTVLKVIGEVLLMLLYGLYCYANLLFRVFVPAPKKSLDGEIMLVWKRRQKFSYDLWKMQKRVYIHSLLIPWYVDNWIVYGDRARSGSSASQEPFENNPGLVGLEWRGKQKNCQWRKKTWSQGFCIPIGRYRSIESWRNCEKGTKSISNIHINWRLVVK